MTQNYLKLLLLLVLLLPELSVSAEVERGAADENRLGRAAYIPNWERGEVLDEQASKRFLDHYWPTLKGNYEAGGGASQVLNRVVSNHHGIVSFITPYTKVIRTDYIPSANEAGQDTVSLFAAQGESEPFSLGIRNESRKQNISVEVSDLSNQSTVFPSRHITKRLVLAYEADAYIGRRKYQSEIRPMVMVKAPGNRWRFPPHTTHNFIIDVHVPLGTKPGHYLGVVTVTADGKVAREIRLRLEVLPFHLKINHYHAGAYGATYNIWEGGFFGYYPEMIEMDARYGFNIAGGFYNKGGEIPFRRSDAGQLEVDERHPKFSKFDQTMKLMKQFGMGDVAFWNWGGSGNVRQFNDVLEKAGIPAIDTDKGKRGFAEICRAIKNAEEKFGWPELVINPFDEALKDQDATRHIIDSIPYVRQISPKTRLYMTEWREHYARHYQSSGKHLSGKGRPRWSEYAKLLLSLEKPIRNFDIIGSNTLSSQSRQLQDKLEGEYWHYTAVTRLGPQVRFAYGFKPYIARSEAVLIWANYKGELNGKGWTLHYVLPDQANGRKIKNTRGPVIASPRAIAAREGIDDRKYIETLRYHALKRNSLEDLSFLDALTERVRSLARLEGIGGIENTEAVVTRADAFQTIRSELKERILRLL